MFDIGFSELVLVGIVALLVIGPERLPETLRTAMFWLNRIRRGFNEIKQEVQQELHNDAVVRELRETGKQIKQEANTIGRDLQETTAMANASATTATSNAPVTAASPPEGLGATAAAPQGDTPTESQAK